MILKISLNIHNKLQPTQKIILKSRKMSFEIKYIK